MNELILRQYYNSDALSYLSPIGDVNNDGYDDYIETFAQSVTQSNTLHYGSTDVIQSDSLLLYTGTNAASFIYRTQYLGDLNGDNIDDFSGLILHPNIYVWYGNENLTANYDISLTPQWSGDSNNGRGLVHGDLNNDGFDDVIGSEPVSYGDNGGFRIWLGGANMNGTSDLTKVGTHSGMLLGTGMAAGDFNGDGLCDIAASAPHSSTFDSTPGRVYVYAGNAQLVDTTVGNEDEVELLNTESVNLYLYPNPVKSGQQIINYTIDGKLPDNMKTATLATYNIKGQMISKHSLKMKQVKQGKGSIISKRLKPGIYLIALIIDNQRTATTKFTIK